MTEQEMKRIFSQNLKAVLSESGKSQMDLAEHMKVGKSTVSFWCNGQKLPRMNKIDEICSWLGVRRSRLMEAQSSLSDDEKLLQAIHDKPGLRMMFDASAYATNEDIEQAVAIIKAFYKTKEGGED
jgi:transcriptional regulator with XRE-family HTH domain